MAKKRRAKPPSPARKAEPMVESAPGPWIGLALGYFVAAAAVASVVFPRTFWGIASGHYVPAALGIAALVFIAASFLPGADRLLQRVVSSAHFPTGLIVFAAILMVTAWFNRIEVNWLGDQSLWIRDVDNHDLIHPIEPLSYQLVEFSHHGLMPVAGKDGERLLSVLLGGLFVFLAWVLSGELVRDNPARRAYCSLVLLAAPHVLFYFGYVESYPYLLLGLMAVGWATLRLLRGGNAWIAAASVLAAASMHLFGAGSVAAAALAGWVRRERVMAVTSVIVVFGLMALWLESVNTRAAYFVNDHRTTLTIFDLTQAGWHRFLGWGHLRGMLNIVLLTAGPALCVAPFVPWRRAWAEKRSTLAIMILFVAPAVGGLLFLRMLLGAPRDWDLFAAYLYFIPVAVLWMWLGFAPGKGLPRFSAALLAVSLVHAGLWTSVTLDWDRGMEQARMLYGTASAQSRKPVAKAAEELGILQRERGNYGAALAWFQVCIDRVPWHWRYYNIFAGAAYQGGDTELAKEYFEKCLELDPDTNKPYSDLGKVYLADGDPEAALSLYRTAMRKRGAHPDWYLGVGTAYTLLGDFPAAVATLDSCVTLFPNYSLGILQRGAAKHYAGDSRAGIADLKEGLKHNPGQVGGWQVLYLAAMAEGDSALAREAAMRVRALTGGGR